MPRRLTIPRHMHFHTVRKCLQTKTISRGNIDLAGNPGTLWRLSRICPRMRAFFLSDQNATCASRGRLRRLPNAIAIRSFIVRCDR